MVVDYTSQGDSFLARKPRPFPDVPTNSNSARPVIADLADAFDVSAEGRRVLVIQDERASGDASRDLHLTLITNWFDELRRRAPKR
jgi:hypothetical protein